MANSDTLIDTKAPLAELIVRQGPWLGQRHRISQPSTTIGREAGNDLVLVDPDVSGRHANLAWDGRYWIIQDLGSTNGTYVNGVRLAAPRVLQEGDVVGLGRGILLSFRAEPAPEVAAVDRQGWRESASPFQDPGSPRWWLVPLLAAAVVLACILAAGLVVLILGAREAVSPAADARVLYPAATAPVEPTPRPAEPEVIPTTELATAADAGPEPGVGAPAATVDAGPVRGADTPPIATADVGLATGATIEPTISSRPVGSAPGSLVQPEDLVYAGAFRLPDDADPPRTFEYGGNAMTFSPDGDPANADPYPGSLFVTGHDRVAYGYLPDGDQVAEVSIPVPAIADNPASLPQAAFLQGFHDVTAGYFTELEEIPKVDMQYLSHPATGPRIHLVWGQHLQPDNVPSHAWFNPTLATPDLQGAWFIGNQDLYSTSSYLFDIPTSWADANAGGRYLATGRMRDGGQGGMGPTLFAYRPWLPDGSAPPSGTHLEETTLLLYETVYNTPDFVRCLEGYQHADEWEGGAWMTTPSGKSAVLFAGTKSTGTKMWYGFINPLGPEYPCVDQYVTDFDTCRMADGSSCPAEDYAGCCDDEQGTCASGRGWWSTRFDAQFILYDPADLALVAAGAMDPWEPQPYASLDIDEYLYLDPPEWDLVTVGWGEQRRNRIGPAAFDRTNALLYVLEQYGEGAKPVVHVWRIAE